MENLLSFLKSQNINFELTNNGLIKIQTEQTIGKSELKRIMNFCHNDELDIIIKKNKIIINK